MRKVKVLFRSTLKEAVSKFMMFFIFLTWKKFFFSVCQLMENGYSLVFRDNYSWLWHKIFCHLNFHGLKLLKQNDMVQGLPEIHTEVDPCESCIMEKHYRKSFPKWVSWRASVFLELIHTNICGPMKTPSLGIQRYFLISIDDFSRMTWV